MGGFTVYIYIYIYIYINHIQNRVINHPPSDHFPRLSPKQLIPKSIQEHSPRKTRHSGARTLDAARTRPRGSHLERFPQANVSLNHIEIVSVKPWETAHANTIYTQRRWTGERVSDGFSNTETREWLTGIPAVRGGLRHRELV